MYVRDMEDAKAVIWKAKTLPYGDPCYEDEEEIEYKPCCPTCGKVFEDLISITKYCPDCGTKLWRYYWGPEIVGEDEWKKEQRED